MTAVSVETSTYTLLHQFERRPKDFVTVPIYYITDAKQLPDLVEWAQRQRALLVDIETDGRSSDGLDWRSKKIATLQIGTPLGKDPRAYVICIRSIEEGPNPEALQPILDLMSNPDIVKLGQNIKFEIAFMTEKWGIRFERVACCQVAEQILRAGLFDISKGSGDDEGHGRKIYGETSMKRLAMLHLEIDLEKDKSGDVRLEFWVTPKGRLSQKQLIYAAGDVVYPAWIAQEQKAEIVNRGLRSVMEIEFDLLPVLVDSECYGIMIDLEAWHALTLEAQQDIADAREALDKLLLPISEQADLFSAEEAKRPTHTRGGKIKEINYNSADQIKQAFVRYCRSIKWPVEPVTTMVRLNQLKRQYGKRWLEKHPEKTDADIPDWVLPEDKYVVLLSVEAPVLRVARCLKQLPHDIVEYYLRYKDGMKRFGTYGVKFIEGPDRKPTTRCLQCHSRIKFNYDVQRYACVKCGPQKFGIVHTQWHQAITSTGRLSSEPNLQNIPRDPRYRACFKPRQGNRFCIRDYSQIEPRLSAQVSKDALYTRTFLEGEEADLYVRVGEAQTGREIDKTTKLGKILRAGVKATVLGTAYNMGVWKMRDSLILNLERYILAGEIEPPNFEFAKDALQGFFRVAPGIKEYQNQCIAHADPASESAPRIWDKYLGEVVTYIAGPCGRKRFFPPTAKNVYTEAPNHPIQGTSATITKYATILLWRRAFELGIDLHFVNYMHDELIPEVAAEHASIISQELKECMERAARRWITDVPVFANADGEGIFEYWHKED